MALQNMQNVMNCTLFRRKHFFLIQTINVELKLMIFLK